MSEVLKRFYSLKTKFGRFETFEKFEVFDVKTQVGGLFREDRRVRCVASRCLQGVVDFVVHAEVDSSWIESAVFVVESLALSIAVHSLYFVVDEEQVGVVCGVSLLRVYFCGLIALVFAARIVFGLFVNFVFVVSLFFDFLRSGEGNSIVELDFFEG